MKGLLLCHADAVSHPEEPDSQPVVTLTRLSDELASGVNLMTPVHHAPCCTCHTALMQGLPLRLHERAHFPSCQMTLS